MACLVALHGRKPMCERLQFENEAYMKGYHTIIGLDEAGRGPMAGPLVVGGVIFPKDFYDERINDSKKLSEKKRELLYDFIVENALAFDIEIISVEEVDELNVYEASRTGMRRIIDRISVKPDFALTDAMPLGEGAIDHLSIIKGDAKSMSMLYPGYGFEKNKGYVTKAHKEALEKYGVCPIHRRSFKPVRDVLNKQLSIFDDE